MNQCGQCKFAKPIPADLQQKSCMFGPPQIATVPVQTPQGPAMQTGTFRPHVGARDEAPSCFVKGVYGLDAVVVQGNIEDSAVALRERDAAL